MTCFNCRQTGLRFFTVYGPWGRPDMALFTFTRNILEGRSIQVFNHGHHTRDFTYIDDIAEGVIRASDQPAAANPNWDPRAPDPATSRAPWRLFNIGNTSPVQLLDYIRAIEDALGMAAKLDLQPAHMATQPPTRHRHHPDPRSGPAEQHGFSPRHSGECRNPEGVGRTPTWQTNYARPQRNRLTPKKSPVSEGSEN